MEARGKRCGEFSAVKSSRRPVGETERRAKKENPRMPFVRVDSKGEAWVGLRFVCRTLAVCARTVKRYVADGRLEGRQLEPHRLFVSLASLERMTGISYRREESRGTKEGEK